MSADMLDGLSLAGLWALLIEPFLEFGFMRRALAGCLALSVSAAPMGVFLMLRRMSMTGDAMAHAILPGAAIGYLFAGLSLGAMTIGGIVAGLVVAVASGLVARGTVLREDASMAAFYLISLALGVLIGGDTRHHEMVGQSVSHALQTLALASGIPIINGVIVADTLAQARTRCVGKINRGAEFASAAVEMAAVKRTFSS